MNKGHSGMMFIIFLLLGILINLQFRGIILSEPNEHTSIKKLAAELEAERKENKKLIEQLESIEAEREQLWKNLGDNLNNQ
jgi:cell division protein FtsB